jgi:transposase
MVIVLLELQGTAPPMLQGKPPLRGIALTRSYHPEVLLGLLVYGYATGVFSSRKLERATYDSVAFRFIAANDHPDHDTIATFRRRFLTRIEGLFVQVLILAREMGF